MGFSSSSIFTSGLISALRLFAGACMATAVCTGAVRAEGVVGGGVFVVGNSDVSLVSELGDASLSAELPSAIQKPSSVSRISPRSASQQERIDSQATIEPFPNLRLALPMVVQSTVGGAVDASLAASSRSMSGPMVGIRPHPSTWGSTLGR